MGEVLFEVSILSLTVTSKLRMVRDTGIEPVTPTMSM